MLNFTRLPVTQAGLKQCTSKSYVLHSLLQKLSIDYVNAPTTFPIETPSKAEIMLKGEKEGLLKPRQYFAYAKLLMTFYKAGVKNAWNNRRESSRIMATHFLEMVDKNGDTIKAKPLSFNQLSDFMSQIIFMSRLELDAVKKLNNASVSDSTPNMVKRHKTDGKDGDPVADVKSQLFRLTRSEFQLYYRSGKDIQKLALFFLTLLIFEEFTPLICYYIPTIAPSTCLLPNIYPRIWKPEALAALESYKQQQNQLVEVYATKNAYSLNDDEVRLMSRALRLVGGIVPVGWYPMIYLRRRLQNHFNYLTVDNYYLSGLNGNGNVWDLSRQELILCCLERGLLSCVGDIPSNESMQWSLIRFIYEFENANVGYIGLNAQLEPLGQLEKETDKFLIVNS
ncbi:uncharacterized protein KQ657_004148 [Scheffersomyces spartinae]|uniref:Uncharacterized protein n=1 Tax=Scheffersomyces spartinae TaxID=45513 RepID=A0A9P7VC21_9ASCO|nr:uncharacterized protein KQ657_004148 [Scheffersomyces spartinae]KAG7195035.1 hypothetical protein KQ657_004148 [Scheffersomyces spartinae]